jgi:hypothetical protein
MTDNEKELEELAKRLRKQIATPRQRRDAVPAWRRRRLTARTWPGIQAHKIHPLAIKLWFVTPRLPSSRFYPKIAVRNCFP